MSEFRAVDRVIPRIERPHCEHCDRDMWLVSIKPADAGQELRTFECARCAASQTILARQVSA